MIDKSNDHGSGPYDAPTRPIPMHRPQSLLGGEPPDYQAPLIDRHEPLVHPVSMVDRVEPRTVGLLASMVFGGLLVIAVALTLFRGGDDASTQAAGSGVVATPVGQALDPSATEGAAAQLPSTSMVPSTPSTLALESSTTISSTTTTAPTTTAAPTTPSTAAPTTAAPASTAAPTTSSTTEAPTSTAPSTSEGTSTTMADGSTTTGPPTTMTTPSETTTSTVADDPSTPPTAAGPSGDDAAIQQQVLDATNAERVANGCGPLTMDPLLNRAADGHSEDMSARDYFSHTDPEERGPGFRIEAVGYAHRGWAENIAAGYGSAEAVVTGWMNSSGHRANILNCAFDQIGIGYAEDGRYWTQVFATRA